MTTSETRPRRVDARRSVEAILDAATECLAADPDASVNHIAATAGVGRMTLYGHFKTRADLVAAVLARAVERADEILASTDTSGEPAEALARLVGASWGIVGRQRNILHAAQRELAAEQLRGTHDRVMHRLEALIERGRRSGAFRRDVPKHWLVTVAYSLMHATADEVTAGRVKPQQAEQLLVRTLQAAFVNQCS